MKKLIKLAACAAAMLIPWTAEARFDDRNAIHACKQAARAQYGARGFSGMVAANRGGGYFKVMGTMHRSGQADAVLRCRVRDGTVDELSVKGSGATAAEVGTAIGVIAGAAIIGAISGDHRHDDYERPSNLPGYGGGRSYVPRAGFICYPRQSACYRDNGRFAPRMTRQEFGNAAARPPQSGVSEREMQRYCQGEASARFQQRPRNITTLPVEREGARYVVYGQFPPAGRYVTTFKCIFNARGNFVRVDRT